MKTNEKVSFWNFTPVNLKSPLGGQNEFCGVQVAVYEQQLVQNMCTSLVSCKSKWVCVIYGVEKLAQSERKVKKRDFPLGTSPLEMIIRRGNEFCGVHVPHHTEQRVL